MNWATMLFEDQKIVLMVTPTSPTHRKQEKEAKERTFKEKLQFITKQLCMKPLHEASKKYNEHEHPKPELEFGRSGWIGWQQVSNHTLSNRKLEVENKIISQLLTLYLHQTNCSPSKQNGQPHHTVPSPIIKSPMITPASLPTSTPDFLLFFLPPPTRIPVSKINNDLIRAHTLSPPLSQYHWQL